MTWSKNIAAIAYVLSGWKTLSTVDYVKFAPMQLNRVVMRHFGVHMQVLHSLVDLFNSGDEVPENQLIGMFNDYFKSTQLHRSVKAIRDYRKVERGRISKENDLHLNQFFYMILYWTDIVNLMGQTWRASARREGILENKHDFKIAFKIDSNMSRYLKFTGKRFNTQLPCEVIDCLK